MARRLLSTAVSVRPAPADVMAIPQHLLIQTLVPTEAEVRDAIARVTRDLEFTRLARGPNWEPNMDSFVFNVQVLDSGEVVLRGTMIIERSDA